jgi:hypothetical protein
MKMDNDTAEVVKVTLHRADGSTEEMVGEQFIVAVGNPQEPDEEGNTGDMKGVVEAGLYFTSCVIESLCQRRIDMMMEQLPQEKKDRIQRIIKAIEGD